ncbi:MAG TPA: hypothetical protein VL306_00510 [Methylomirabilota bacterium]|jgi:hypothetical protein|nr:hypothetical protein [Methylomirabilota bacterium]
MPEILPRRDNSVGGPTEASAETKTQVKLEQAVLKTLAFFSLYELPLSSRRVHELLYGEFVSLPQVTETLGNLVVSGQVLQKDNLYSLKSWNAATYQANQLELIKKWEKIDRYFNWLAVLPFVRNISVINSLSLGTSDADSDIDFFVITKPNRLYFVRSLIIVLFRSLGVYKTRQKIKDRFCFGFYTTTDNLEFESLKLKPEDPYFDFWLANMRPVVGSQAYWQLMQKNPWLTQAFPNFEPTQRFASAKKPSFIVLSIKYILEVLLWLPVSLAEPFFRRIHINHTFKLAENRGLTSTTIANSSMLKLHGYDVRAEIAERFKRIIETK